MRKTIPLIFLAACIEGVGDYHLKLYSKNKKQTQPLVVAIGSYAALMYVLIQVLEDDQLSNMNCLWNMFSQVINTSIGVGLLGEQLTDQEWTGQGLSLSGLLLIANEPARPT